MSNLKNQIELLQEEFNTELNEAFTKDLLEQVRVKYLGRHGLLSNLMHQLKSLSPEEKKESGPLLNKLKKDLELSFENKYKQILEQEENIKLGKKANFDVSAYAYSELRGSLHPISIITEEIENIFISMGYEVVYGPEVESEYHNFDALNIPHEHPAREAFDTFWLNLPGKLLRTHTSNAQIHAMTNKKPPLAIISHGRCYRNEATDSSHDFMFNQIEGLFVDKNISIAHLLGTAKNFLQAIFDKSVEIKVRPSYFPFVEPGLEFDISCPFCKSGCSTCKHTRWIEAGGAGLVHPNVLKAVNIDPKEFKGFAFGLGLTRLIMLKYGIKDIRLLHSNKLDFLQQF